MSWLNKIKRDAISSRLLDEQIYAKVLSEIENGQRRDGLWAKALANSDGINEKAKSLYIKYRADSIRDEIDLAAKNHNQDDKSAASSGGWSSNNSEAWGKSRTWGQVLALFIAAIFLLVFIVGR